MAGLAALPESVLRRIKALLQTSAPQTDHAMLADGCTACFKLHPCCSKSTMQAILHDHAVRVLPIGQWNTQRCFVCCWQLQHTQTSSWGDDDLMTTEKAEKFTLTSCSGIPFGWAAAANCLAASKTCPSGMLPSLKPDSQKQQFLYNNMLSASKVY